MDEPKCKFYAPFVHQDINSSLTRFINEVRGDPKVATWYMCISRTTTVTLTLTVAATLTVTVTVTVAVTVTVTKYAGDVRSRRLETVTNWRLRLEKKVG
jgi:hypothetical protein